MRSPSSRVLINRVSIFKATASRGSDGEPTFVYPSSPTAEGVSCSVQFDSADEVIDDQQRITVLTRYRLYFTTNPGVKPRDKITWNDHTMFAEAASDNAGRGRVFKIVAVERQ